MSDLTLCMIVRDEEEMLADCLASAQQAVDRIVIVDTGSRDGTRQVSERFGAEWIEHPWQDDFSAARNAALSRVEQGYVLVLDADERLTPRGVRTLRAAVRKGTFDLGLLPLHDAATLDASSEDVVSGRARRGDPQWLPRLLRVTPDLRYEGIVHESVAAWARAGRHSEFIEAPIIHYGAVPQLRAARNKDERNRRLLERRCEREPENPSAWAYHAAELERCGEAEAALEAARHAFRAWQSCAEKGEQHDPVLPATLLGQLALRFDHPGEARAAADEALGSEEHPNLHLLAGVADEQSATAGDTDALTRAASHYARCLELAAGTFTSEVMPGAVSWQAATRLGTARLRLGEPEAAREAFLFALNTRTDLREAGLGLTEALLDCGEVDTALRHLPDLLRDPDPDAWLLAARGALRMQAMADAQLFFERAQQTLANRPFCAPHRRQWLAEIEEELAAASTPATPSAHLASKGTCAFAWPRYDEREDLDVLLGQYGKELSESKGLVLCLRHDVALDGAVELAEQGLERAFAEHLGEGCSLEIVLLDGSQIASELAAPDDVAIELPHTTGPRRRFIDALGVRCIANRAELERVLRVRSGPTGIH